MSKRWFMMDAQTWAAAERACRARHEATGRGELSVVPNILSLQYVVKVAGAEKAWRKAQPWIANIDGIWDESDHHLLAEIMAGVEWRGVENDPGALPV